MNEERRKRDARKVGLGIAAGRCVAKVCDEAFTEHLCLSAVSGVGCVVKNEVLVSLYCPPTAFQD